MSSKTPTAIPGTKSTSEISGYVKSDVAFNNVNSESVETLLGFQSEQAESKNVASSNNPIKSLKKKKSAQLKKRPLSSEMEALLESFAPSSQPPKQLKSTASSKSFQSLSNLFTNIPSTENLFLSSSSTPNLLRASSSSFMMSSFLISPTSNSPIMNYADESYAYATASELPMTEEMAGGKETSHISSYMDQLPFHKQQQLLQISMGWLLPPSPDSVMLSTGVIVGENMDSVEATHSNPEDNTKPRLSRTGYSFWWPSSQTDMFTENK
jgi:hypothetical protein